MYSGSLVYKDYIRLIKKNKIKSKNFIISQIQPSSVDLTLSNECYEISASFLASNNKVRSKLKNVKLKDENSNKIYILTIETGVDKIVTSKDSKGNPKTYKMISTINLTTIKDEKEYNMQLESVENYNDISSKFELENFEKNLKRNSASKIAQEIILYLITL